jgi:hypothetical protein
MAIILTSLEVFIGFDILFMQIFLIIGFTKVTK